MRKKAEDASKINVFASLDDDNEDDTFNGDDPSGFVGLVDDDDDNDISTFTSLSDDDDPFGNSSNTGEKTGSFSDPNDFFASSENDDDDDEDFGATPLAVNSGQNQNNFSNSSMMMSSDPSQAGEMAQMPAQNVDSMQYTEEAQPAPMPAATTAQMPPQATPMPPAAPQQQMYAAEQANPSAYDYTQAAQQQYAQMATPMQQMSAQPQQMAAPMPQAAPEPYTAAAQEAPQQQGFNPASLAVPQPSMILKIINVSDIIRNNLSNDEKSSVKLVLNMQKTELDELSEMVYAVLNAPKALMGALEALLTAQQMGDAQRAFYLIRLDDRDLMTIIDLSGKFNGSKTKPSGNDHYAIAEAANSMISNLSETSVQLLIAVYTTWQSAQQVMSNAKHA